MPFTVLLFAGKIADVQPQILHGMSEGGFGMGRANHFVVTVLYANQLNYRGIVSGS